MDHFAGQCLPSFQIILINSSRASFRVALIFIWTRGQDLSPLSLIVTKLSEAKHFPNQPVPSLLNSLPSVGRIMNSEQFVSHLKPLGCCARLFGFILSQELIDHAAPLAGYYHTVPTLWPLHARLRRLPALLQQSINQALPTSQNTHGLLLATWI